MRVALYQPWIYLHGGLEKSLLEVVTRSRHQWTIYTGHYEPENTFPQFAALDVRVLNPTTIKRTIGGTFYSAWQVVTQRVPLDEADVLVVWCDGIGDLVTFRNGRRPIVNICSTPLRAAFDPVYQQLAVANKSLLYRLPFVAFKFLFRFVDRLAWRRYAGIVTTSTEVRNRIVDGRLCTNPAKMVMAYPGIEWSELPADTDYQPFVLIAGRIMWTKNIQQGIEAFVAAGLPAPWKLVVAGFVDAKSRTYLEQLRKLVPAHVDVEFVVSPTDAELDELYRRASFCLFTPLNEDWGIVPLEAMRRGKPVVANAKGGPLESIVDGETGILVEADNPRGWENAIRALAFDPPRCKAMGVAAHRDMQRFTWSRFVEVIDDGLQHWVGGTVGSVVDLPPIEAAIEAVSAAVVAVVVGDTASHAAASAVPDSISGAISEAVSNVVSNAVSNSVEASSPQLPAAT